MKDKHKKAPYCLAGYPKLGKIAVLVHVSLPSYTVCRLIGSSDETVHLNRGAPVAHDDNKRLLLPGKKKMGTVKKWEPPASPVNGPATRTKSTKRYKKIFITLFHFRHDGHFLHSSR